MLGDESVGKTSLLNKWIRRSFDDNTSPTIGGAAFTQRDEVQGQTYCFQIWDTAGAEKFRALTPLYARDSRAAAIVFDLTRRTSFQNLQSWVSFLRQQGDIPFVLIGNKEDLQDSFEVTPEDATDFAYSVNAQFFSASAKRGSNVELAFRQVEIEAVDNFRASGGAPTEGVLLLDPATVPKADGGCC
jgi:small GTP-binding protein